MSAIDALSYHALDPNCLVCSTAGAHPNPEWISRLISKDFEVFCGFDADKTSDTFAEKMIALYPSVIRSRPSNHDLRVISSKTVTD